ncbi:cyclic nucleotide-binding protein [Flavobacterium branchiophilum]|uniref:Cyclic nucleotide-binding protein n=1 Tax=Flavobacterium branchiophilum TaxID=55197 RepID=A0A2H3KZ32_9FLAO|nr:cyclic nucleotide-binding protein [Flavobacterium branchiophilum]
MENIYIKEFIKEEQKQLKKLHDIVKKSIDAEELIIQNLILPPLEKLTKEQKISDKVAQFGGSWNFIISFFLLLIVWIIFNVLAKGFYKFDPYPFILMNLILSCIAALQAPIIMMSQKRQEEKDRKRSENDYLINLKAEMQVRSLNQKMDLLLEEQIKTLFETQEKQFLLLKELNDKLDYLKFMQK